MCKAFKISRSSYYSWLRRVPSKRTLENNLLKSRIRDIHLKSRMTYGSPRVCKELIMEGFNVSRVRVAKLMSQEGIRSKINKKYRYYFNITMLWIWKNVRRRIIQPNHECYEDV